MAKCVIVFKSENKGNLYYANEDNLKKALLKIIEHEIKYIYIQNNTDDFVAVGNISEYKFKEKGKCELTGRYFLSKNLKYFDGVGLISRGNWTKIKKCSDCGKYTIDGKHFLVHTSRGDKEVCEDCIGRYRKCTECGEYFSDNLVHSIYENGTYINICNHCIELSTKYKRCSRCGDVYEISSMIYHHDRDSFYCNACYNDIEQLIQGYHHTRDLRFINLGNEDTKRYFGIELEIGGQDENDTIMAKHIREQIKHVECKHDSSIEDGFEIVTSPMTYKYLESIKCNWKSVLSKAISRGFSSNENVNCGMHIHVSRNALSENAIDRICQIFEAFWDNIFIFSRRKKTQLNWCGRYWKNTNKIKKKELKKITKSNGDRYRAVNLTNDSTVEFRIFNGTLDLTEFYANIQFIDRLCNISNDYSDEDFNKLTWNKIINDKGNYEDLFNYSKRFSFQDADKELSSSFESEEERKKVIKLYKGEINKEDLHKYEGKLISHPSILKILPVGTKVRISSNMVAQSKSIGKISIVEEMTGLASNWYTIKKAEYSGGIFNTYYRIDDNTHYTWTIDMFDMYILPVGTKLTTLSESSLEIGVPYGYNHSMSDLDVTITISEYNDLKEIERYGIDNEIGSTFIYNNFMFKELAYLNLAIDGGTSYDNLKWI